MTIVLDPSTATPTPAARKWSAVTVAGLFVALGAGAVLLIGGPGRNRRCRPGG